MDGRDRTFLLAGIPWFQWLLAGPPWLAFLKLATPGTAMVLLSIPAGVASIPATHATGFAQNLGFLFRNNWTWPYVVVVPIALLLLRRLSEDIRQSVADLEEMKILVPAGEAGGSFLALLEARLAATGKRVWIWSVVAVLAFTVFDTLEIARGYIAFATVPAGTACAFGFSEVDWSVAFAAGGCWGDVLVDPAYMPPGQLRNAAFNTVAYAMQSAMIVSFLIFFLRLAQFFYVLSSSLRGAGFTLVPWFGDPMKRLGLGPLGRTYNLFLTLILIFETYVAAHRLQQIALIRGLPITEYARELLAASSQPATWLDPAVHHFETTDVGTWVLMIAVVLPIVLVCWFPLLQMRGYIQARKLELTKDLAKKRREADEEGNEREAARYAKQVDILDESNVWPNGDATAQRFLTAMGVMWLGALFPVVFAAVALGAFGVMELIRFVVWVYDRVKPRREGAGAAA
ncbi:MAG: hypothetical protein AMXMBFR53_01190 [Gemmatimonadota bacterium]